jgi:hypothetical protein
MTERKNQLTLEEVAELVRKMSTWEREERSYTGHNAPPPEGEFDFNLQPHWRREVYSGEAEGIRVTTFEHIQGKQRGYGVRVTAKGSMELASYPPGGLYTGEIIYIGIVGRPAVDFAPKKVEKIKGVYRFSKRKFQEQEAAKEKRRLEEIRNKSMGGLNRARRLIG